jgi:hypothetical protein
MPGAPIVPAGPKPKPLNLSSKPLKSFNWTKLPPAKVKDTIWSALDDEDVHKVMKGSGYDEIEELFAAKEVKAEQQSAPDLSSKILGQRQRGCVTHVAVKTKTSLFWTANDLKIATLCSKPSKWTLS